MLKHDLTFLQFFLEILYTVYSHFVDERMRDCSLADSFTIDHQLLSVPALRETLRGFSPPIFVCFIFYSFNIITKHDFSIPAAKKVNMVYANDLNPESYKWLLHNATKNKE
jgi:Met-10+ like-protein